jgi:hypothetical protein
MDKWNWLELSEFDANVAENVAMEATIHLPSVSKRWRRINRATNEAPIRLGDTGTNTIGNESELSFDVSSWRNNGTDEWSSSSISPRGRCSHSLTAVGRYALILCGGAYSAAATHPQEEGQPPARTVFVPLNDLWILNATTAIWSKIQPVIRPPFLNSHTSNSLQIENEPQRRTDPFEANGEESANSFWGMSDLYPPRRGHMAAYYEDPSHQHPTQRNSSPLRHSNVHRYNHSDERETMKRRFLIVFGGVTNNNHNTATTVSDDDVVEPEIYLNDVWVFHLEHRMWRQLHPTVEGHTSRRSLPPPSPRRHAICWVDEDYFCILGGDIQGPSDGDMLNHQWQQGNHHQGRHVPLDDDDEEGHDDERQLRIPTHQGMYVYRLGPLFLPVSRWGWSLQATTNKYVLHKRGPNWPTVTLPPRRVSALLNAASVCVGRKLWIHGGVELVEQHQMATNYLYRLDLDTWEWVIVQGLKRSPCARCHHGIAAIGKYILVGGGMGYLSRKDVVVDIEVRLPEDNEEDEHDDHPNDRFMLRSIFDLHILDTETLTWKQEHATNIIGDWPKARNAFGMTRLGQNKVIVFGGGVFPDKYFDDTHVLEFDLPLCAESTDDSICRVGCDTVLRSDLSALFQSGLLSDLTLHVGGNTATRAFHVHKAILASRCQFFETMFAGPYAEAHSREIALPDADPMAVDVVLRFFYTGEVDTKHVLFFRRENECSIVNPYLVSAVLQLCDKWNVFQLGRTIEDALAAAVHKGWVDPVELVAFAKEHNCRRLILHSLAYVKQKWESLRFSESLQNVEPYIVAEIEDFVHSLL